MRKAYHISIDREACVGDGLCSETAPQTFMIDHDGKSMVVDPDGEESKYIKEAARSCRLQAITLYDRETGKRIWPK